MKNKRRSRNREGKLVTKSHFEHHIINNSEVFEVAKETILPFCLKNGIRMVIADNDSKLHHPKLVDYFEEHGVEIYDGAGKTCGAHKNGYPPRSHDCNPIETAFANIYQEAQLDLQRREKNAGCRRTMKMWKNALDYTWDNYPTKEFQKLFNRMPKIMEKIIQNKGGRTKY